MNTLKFGLVLFLLILCSCSENNNQSLDAKYPDTAKGVADAMNDAARTAVQEEEAMRQQHKVQGLSPEYYNQLGKDLVKSEKYEEALESFKLSCEQGNADGCLNFEATLQYYKRYAHFIRKKREQVEEHKIEKKLSANPNDTSALIEQAKNYALDRQYRLALNIYNKALSINPSESEGFLGRGYVYSSMQRYDKAIEDYNRAIELNPRSIQAFTNRGVAYAKIGDIKQGITDLQTACDMGDSMACGALSTFISD